jgi:hypothetical protein
MSLETFETNQDENQYEIKGFSYFNDSKEFKYDNDGDIRISTDCSSWSKVLLNNMKLDDYLYSEALVPSDFLAFPVFKNNKRIKKRKESVGNYIENCEFCDEYLEKSYRFEDKIVCFGCMYYINLERCIECDEPNIQCCNFMKCSPENRKIMRWNWYNSVNYYTEHSYCEKCYCPRYYQDMYSHYYEYDLEDDNCTICGSESGHGICSTCRMHEF